MIKHLVCLTIMLLSFCMCNSTEFIAISGETMGTYYRIKTEVPVYERLKEKIDSLLNDINMEVSTWINDSYISQLNDTVSELPLSYLGKIPFHFDANFEVSKEIFKLTHGAFDPTVMPLVNYWGFGFHKEPEITGMDSARVEQLKYLIGFNQVHKKNKGQMATSIYKLNPMIQLDFSAIAKGYAIDQIADFLSKGGSTQFLVEIGGEIRTKGNNDKGKKWLIGINTPVEDAFFTDIFDYVALSDISMATSGNYRNYYEKDGVKYSHTINPFTGFPERTKLLSASVLHENCMTADAFATAFMVMGLEKSMKLAEQLDGIEAAFIVINDEDQLEMQLTKGFIDYIWKENE